MRHLLYLLDCSHRHLLSSLRLKRREHHPPPSDPGGTVGGEDTIPRDSLDELLLSGKLLEAGGLRDEHIAHQVGMIDLVCRVDE